MRDISALKALHGGAATSEVGMDFNGMAYKDLSSLFARVGLSLKRNVNWFALFDQSDQVADLLIVGHDMTKPEAVFPSEHIRPHDKTMLVGIVCYEGGTAKDAYLFPGSLFKSEHKKGKPAKIKLSKKQKLEQYSFGVAVNNLKKN
ncbi:MAG: hypothetical protein FWE31_03545 [Firmicutes bacterium]|nr:hypothetical protein [Bacillota bacterium]